MKIMLYKNGETMPHRDTLKSYLNEKYGDDWGYYRRKIDTKSKKQIPGGRAVWERGDGTFSHEPVIKHFIKSGEELFSHILVGTNKTKVPAEEAEILKPLEIPRDDPILISAIEKDKEKNKDIIITEIPGVDFKIYAEGANEVAVDKNHIWR